MESYYFSVANDRPLQGGITAVKSSKFVSRLIVELEFPYKWVRNMMNRRQKV